MPPSSDNGIPSLLSIPNAWKQCFERKSKVSQAYMNACAGVPTTNKLDANFTPIVPIGQHLGVRSLDNVPGFEFSLALWYTIGMCFAGHCPIVPEVTWDNLLNHTPWLG